MTAKNESPAKKKVGRPSLYRDEYAGWAKKLCRLGATDADLARSFEVSEDTINEWKTVHPEFSVSIKEGKELSDAEVAEKLFRRATGYKHKAVKIASDPNGREHVTEYEEHYPPDTAAAIFWLKNRRPDMWRDKQEVNHSGSVALYDAEQIKRMAALANV